MIQKLKIHLKIKVFLPILYPWKQSLTLTFFKIFQSSRTCRTLHISFQYELRAYKLMLNLSPHLHGFHYPQIPLLRFLAYVRASGDFHVSREPPTVLTWFRVTRFFFKSQNPRKAGTLCRWKFHNPNDTSDKHEIRAGT